jgi:uncharacterized ion transporter superfamily protein YfcC
MHLFEGLCKNPQDVPYAYAEEVQAERQQILVDQIEQLRSNQIEQAQKTQEKVQQITRWLTIIIVLLVVVVLLLLMR